LNNDELARIINHPHDHYFKHTFGKTAVARDFLKSYLPEEILKVMDLDTLTNQKGEYVDKKLKKFYSDLLYKVSINGKNGYIYILYEHKSYHDEKTIFQLLKYMAGIWNELYNIDEKSVPPILPILIYHGEKKLEVKTRLWKIIEGIEDLPKELKEMIPDFKFKAYDYSPPGTEKIKGTSLVQAILWMLKAIREKDFEAFHEGFKKFEEQMQFVAKTYGVQTAMEITELTMLYIFNARSDIDEEALSKALPEGGEGMETIAKRLVKKGEKIGEQRGEKRGEKKGETRLLWNQIKNKFPEIDETYYDRLKQLDTKEIEALSLALLDMQTQEELNQYL